MKKTNKLRVVLDTNIVISAVIIKKSIPHQIFEKWQNNDLTLLISNKIIREIDQVLRREKISKKYYLSREAIENIIKSLTMDAEFVIPTKIEKLPVHCRDPKDDMVLALAVGGEADYLVTGDKDLLDLKNEKGIGKLKIVTANQFLDLVL